MKRTIEIEVPEPSIEEALKILEIAARTEMHEYHASCHALGCEGVMCTRPEGHFGPHIALGSENICKMWYCDERGYKKQY